MDLFNRRKVKELEIEKDAIERDNAILSDKNSYLEEHIIRLEKELDKKGTNANLVEENRKLLDWIQKILDTFGTCDSRERHISIPVYKREIVPFYGPETFGELHQERIEIPAITIIKMRWVYGKVHKKGFRQICC